MDIEGAEYDALQGFLRAISDRRPHLILESDLGPLFRYHTNTSFMSSSYRIAGQFK